MSDNINDDNTDKILGAINVVSASVSSLTRTVDRIDNRLVDVEKQLVEVDQRLGGVEKQLVSIDQRLVGVENQTQLIPAILDAVTEQSVDLDNHEKRLNENDKRISRLERSAA